MSQIGTLVTSDLVGAAETRRDFHCRDQCRKRANQAAADRLFPESLGSLWGTSKGPAAK